MNNKINKIALQIRDDKIKKLQNEIKDLRKEIKRAEKDSESMHKHVESARTANRRKFVPPSRSKKTKDDWVRLIIPDVHGSSMDALAVSTVLSDLKRLQVDEIVILGDFIDCGGFLAQHHTLGFVAQTEYTFESDVAAGNQLLDKLLTVCPSVKKIHYLEGNHELRIEKWCITSALRKGIDAKFLYNRVGPENVLDLKGRGIKYYRQSEFYHELSIPGTIKLGNCCFVHGLSTAKHAAAIHAAKMGGNIIYGHTHRGDTIETRTVTAGQIGAWSPGCLCKKQPMWQHTNPTEWTHGFLLQLVSKSGLFQTVMARIVDGKSLLIPVIKHILR